MEEKDMICEKNKPHCPVIDVNGLISNGKQFDIDINLPEDTRDVIYGTIKNAFNEPIKDAVVKLIEIDFGKEGRKNRVPVSHTFTDKYGEFVFGPLCPGKEYAIQIWVNDTKKIKICAKCHHEGKCLKGEKCDKCDCFIESKDKCKKDDCKKDNCKKDDCEKKDCFEVPECK